MTQANPLVSTVRPTESPLAVKLHPLVLLTVTDYISRHSLTAKTDPIVGGVIGQQNGREVTMEHAFETTVKAETLADGKERVFMSEPWFGTRLSQYKEVHAEPPLDLVAVFTLGSVNGPLPQHVPLVQRLKANYNDDVKLILFHAETILDNALGGGKLPVTVWESFYEPGTDDADKGLQVDGWGIGTQLQLKFRQIPFEIETGEAEMIGVDYVAKGAANANLVVDGTRKQSVAATSKGKGRANSTGQANGESGEDYLSPEDEELIASLTSKSNAIKMLHSRINLITTYLSSLPPSYLTNPSLPPTTAEVNHVLLRQISFLLSRLPLLAPQSGLSSTSASPSSDVELVALLSTLTASVASARELSTKSTVVLRSRTDRRMAGLARDAGEQMPSGRRGSGGRHGKGSHRSAPAPFYSETSAMDAGFDSGADGGEY